MLLRCTTESERKPVSAAPRSIPWLTASLATRARVAPGLALETTAGQPRENSGHAAAGKRGAGKLVQPALCLWVAVVSCLPGVYLSDVAQCSRVLFSAVKKRLRRGSGVVFGKSGNTMLPRLVRQLVRDKTLQSRLEAESSEPHQHGSKQFGKLCAAVIEHGPRAACKHGDADALRFVLFSPALAATKAAAAPFYARCLTGAATTAARRRQLECLRVFAANCPHVLIYPDIAVAAVRGGCVECLKLVLNLYSARNAAQVPAGTKRAIPGYVNRSAHLALDFDAGACLWGESLSVVAASSGNLECLHFLHESGCVWGSRVVLASVSGGHVDCLEYVLRQGCPFGRDVCIRAAGVGCLQCLRLIGRSRNFRSWDAYCCAEAACCGKLDCLRYLHENGAPWDELTCQLSAAQGHLDCLRYAHENGCPWDERTCSAACSNGHLDCLLYAVASNCAVGAGACAEAAGAGHLDCLKYAWAVLEAQHHNPRWCASACAAAARNGQTECLSYLHEHGCPWHPSTCAAAANHGNLACLRYAHEHGCPWDAWTCSGAAAGGHLDCLVFAHEHGCPWASDVCVRAAESDMLPCLKYAHENGCPWDGAVCMVAAQNGNYACLRYADQSGCPWSPSGCLRLIKKIRYPGLQDNRPLWDARLGECIVYIENCVRRETTRNTLSVLRGRAPTASAYPHAVSTAHRNEFCNDQRNNQSNDRRNTLPQNPNAQPLPLGALLLRGRPAEPGRRDAVSCAFVQHTAAPPAQPERRNGRATETGAGASQEVATETQKGCGLWKRFKNKLSRRIKHTARLHRDYGGL